MMNLRGRVKYHRNIQLKAQKVVSFNHNSSSNCPILSLGDMPLLDEQLLKLNN